LCTLLECQEELENINILDIKEFIVNSLKMKKVKKKKEKEKEKEK